MENKLIKPTETTPLMEFNASTGIVTIKGSSCCENLINFYRELYQNLESLENYTSNTMTFNLAFENIDNRSIGFIYILVKKMISFNNQDRDVTINWYYKPSNDRIKNDGVDIAYHYNFPLNLKKTSI